MTDWVKYKLRSTKYGQGKASHGWRGCRYEPYLQSSTQLWSGDRGEAIGPMAKDLLASAALGPLGLALSEAEGQSPSGAKVRSSANSPGARAEPRAALTQ